MSDEITSISEFRSAFITPPVSKPLELKPDGSLLIGPSCNKSMVAFMEYYQQMQKRGEPTPIGPFSRLIAERLLNPISKLDALVGCFSPRGMGKSYTCIACCESIAKIMSQMTGEPPERFFTGANVISLQGGDEFARRLDEIQDRSLLICDDAAVAAGSRDFNTKISKNLMRILQTCRVKRLGIFFTAPARSMVDIQIRQMIIINIRVYKSAHAHHYNVLRINTSSTNAFGKEIYARLNSMSGKVTSWICPAPSAAAVALYDAERDRSARELSASITRPQEKTSKTTANRETDYREYGDKVKGFLKENPKISTNAISAKLGIDFRKAQYLKTRALEETNDN